MAYDIQLAARVRDLASREGHLTEKGMFGGLAFMKHGRMAVGLWKGQLMIKIDRNEHERIMKKSHVKPMGFKGRTMKGFVLVDPKGYATRSQLASWVKRGFAAADAMGPKTEKEKAQGKKKFSISTQQEIRDIIAMAQPEMRPVAQALRDVIRDEGFLFVERANPGWRAITYRHEKAGYVCGIFPLKGRVRLIFEHGAKIKDSKRVLKGADEHLRQIRYIEFHTVEEVADMAHAIGDLIRLALRIRAEKN